MQIPSLEGLFTRSYGRKSQLRMARQNRYF
jgi:hypothetical protein